MLRIKLLLPVLGLLCAMTTGAIASDGGDTHLTWGNFAFRVANFALFLGVCVYFFGKKATAFFKGRTEGIAADLANLEIRKAEARKHLEEVERRIANLEHERENILADYEAQGEALKTAILAQAEKTAVQITAQAKLTAQNEINQAIDTMRAELAEAIVASTEKLLAQKLTTEEHTKLVDKYLTKVVLN